MKNILMALLVLALVVCGAGWLFTYQALGATQDILLSTEGALRSTQSSLDEAQTNLRKATISLDETRQKLADQLDQTAKYIQLYESKTSELKSTEAQLKTASEQLSASQKENQTLMRNVEELRQEIEDIKKELSVYKDTLGIKVFSGVVPPYASGNVHQLVLINNNNAANPTWAQLESFLLADRTDKKLYIPGVYECGNFAQDLHNNAEKLGIRAAFVVVHFYSGMPHGLNAFKTLDRGLVYIDVTGERSAISLTHLDKIVKIAKDQPYQPSLLRPENWGMGEATSIVKAIEIYW